MGADIQTVESGGGAAGPLSDVFINDFLAPLVFGGSPDPNAAERARLTEITSTPRGAKFGPAQKVVHHKAGEALAALPAAPSPVDRTRGIMGTIQNLIGGIDTTGLGQSLESLIQQDIESGAANLRERFTSSGAGSSVGTPAAVAESRFRAQAAPRATLAVGQLEQQNRAQQLQAILPILQIIAALSGRGIPQAQTNVIAQPNPFLQLLSAGGGAATGVADVRKAFT